MKILKNIKFTHHCALLVVGVPIPADIDSSRQRAGRGSEQTPTVVGVVGAGQAVGQALTQGQAVGDGDGRQRVGRVDKVLGAVAVHEFEIAGNILAAVGADRADGDGRDVVFSDRVRHLAVLAARVREMEEKTPLHVREQVHIL